MVLLNCKRGRTLGFLTNFPTFLCWVIPHHLCQGEQALFLLETLTSEKMDAVIERVSFIHNERLRIERLCMGIRHRCFAAWSDWL